MAGTAPPVILMICWFCCAPRRKGEAGAETAIPGCKTKFELRSRKKIRRNTTSTSGNMTSQPKLYSLVRLSFIPRAMLDLMIAMRFARTGQCFRRLLKTDDAGERFAVLQHVHDLDAGAFHFVKHCIHAGRKIAVSDERGRGDNQAGRCSQQTFVNAAGKFSDRGVAAVGSNRSEGIDHSGNGSEKTE